MEKKKILLLIILVGLLFLITFTAEAQDNLELGKQLFLEARKTFYNPSSEVEAENKEQAITLLEKSQEYFSKLETRQQSLYWQGRVQFLWAEIEETRAEKREAAKRFKAAEKLAKKALAKKVSSEALTLLADSYMRQFDYKGSMYTAQYGPKALKLLNRAVDRDSNNYRALNSLGNYYYFAPKIGGGDIDKAINSLKRALASDNQHQNFISYVWLGIIMRDGKEKPEKAEEYFNKALEIYPHSGWAKTELKKVS